MAYKDYSKSYDESNLAEKKSQKINQTCKVRKSILAVSDKLT